MLHSFPTRRSSDLAYEDMTDADKAALEEIIAAIGGLSPVELAQFKLSAAEAYETYLALYKAYEADKNGTEPEPPVTTAPEGEDTTASAGGDKKPPQTGDNMMYIFIAAAVAAAACTAVVLIRKKKETV